MKTSVARILCDRTPSGDCKSSEEYKRMAPLLEHMSRMLKTPSIFTIVNTAPKKRARDIMHFFATPDQHPPSNRDLHHDRIAQNGAHPRVERNAYENTEPQNVH